MRVCVYHGQEMPKKNIGATPYPALIGGGMYVVESELTVAYRGSSLYRGLPAISLESYTYAIGALENSKSHRTKPRQLIAKCPNLSFSSSQPSQPAYASYITTAMVIIKVRSIYPRICLINRTNQVKAGLILEDLFVTPM